MRGSFRNLNDSELNALVLEISASNAGTDDNTFEFNSTGFDTGQDPRLTYPDGTQQIMVENVLYTKVWTAGQTGSCKVYFENPENITGWQMYDPQFLGAVSGSVNMSRFINMDACSPYGNPFITEVILPSQSAADRVASFDFRFQNMTQLRSFDCSAHASSLSENNTSANVLSSCTNLTSVTLPAFTASAVGIARFDFGGCSALSALDLPIRGPIRELDLASCTSLTTLTVANDVELGGINLVNSNITGRLHLGNAIMLKGFGIDMLNNSNLTQILIPSGVGYWNGDLSGGALARIDTVWRFAGCSSFDYIGPANSPNSGSGVMDFSGCEFRVNDIYIQFSNLNSFTTLYPPPTSSFDGTYGAWSDLQFDRNSFTGTLDLSNFLIGNINNASDIDVYSNSSLSTLLIPSGVNASNLIRSLDGYSCDLGYVSFWPWSGSTAGVGTLGINIQNNSMTAAEVNQILVDLDTIGWSNSAINISGTNAAPDDSSGGYDGNAATGSLVSKGWTVTTS